MSLRKKLKNEKLDRKSQVHQWKHFLWKFNEKNNRETRLEEIRKRTLL